MLFATPTEVPVNACETASGRYVDAVNPNPKDIDISDISWSLSRQARFAGHTISDEIWSVGQHSIFVLHLIEMALEGIEPLSTSMDKWIEKYAFSDGREDYVNRSARLKRLLMGALMHDASEAYLVDLPSPVKRHELLREPYKALETNMMKVIYTAFDMAELTELESMIVTWADLLALKIEAAHLMPSRGRGWNGEFPVIPLAGFHLMPKPLQWKQVHENFLYEFDRLRAM